MDQSTPVVLASDQPAVPISSVDLGAKSDAAATTDSGVFSLIALTKRMLGKLPALGQATKANSLPVTLASDQGAIAVAAGVPATGQSSSVNSLPVVLANDQTLPLPAGAATDSSLQSILSAIKATVNLSGSVWYDPTVNPIVYYVRRETVNEGTGVVTVTWETPAGAIASPVVANLAAVSNAQNLSNTTVVYTATAAGTGYAAGDTLIHAFGIDTTTVPVRLGYSIWMNAGPSVPNGSILASAPTGGTYVQVTQEISGTVTSNIGATNGLALDGVDATGVTAPAGGTGIRGWLSGIYQALIGVQSVFTANRQVTGNLTAADPTGVAAGSTVTINTDSLGALGIKIGGNGVGTVLFQGSVDGVTWDNPKAYPLTVGAAGVQSASAAGDFEVNCAAFKQFRVCLSALTSGSFSVVLNGTAAPKHIGVKNGNAVDLQVTDASSASVPGRIALTVGTPATAGRSFCAICTVAGNVAVTFADTSVGVYPLAIGINVLPFQVTEVNSVGTTATAIYENWK